MHSRRIVNSNHLFDCRQSLPNGVGTCGRRPLRLVNRVQVVSRRPNPPCDGFTSTLFPLPCPTGRPAATVAAPAALQPLCKPKHASIPDAKYKDCLQAGKSVAAVHQIKSIAEVVAEYRAERS